MKLTVLGKYGPWPAAGGACSGYLLEEGGVRLLLDCGCGVLSRLQQYCGIPQLSGILLSHLHSDHMGDIPVLCYALQFLSGSGALKSKLPIYLPAAPEAAAMPILADKGMDARTVAGGDAIEFNGLHLSFFSVRHPVPCNAVRIDSGSTSFVYSGDLNSTPGFDRFAADADLLLIDGCFLQSEWNKSLPHLSAALAGEVGNAARAKRLVLTHMRPGTDEAAVLDEAKRVFASVEIAREGETYTL